MITYKNFELEFEINYYVAQYKIGSFRNQDDDDGDGNENIKQQLCTCSTLSRTFLCRHCKTTTRNSNFPIFQVGKIATKFEKTRSPLNSDVLAAVTDAVAKASL